MMEMAVCVVSQLIWWNGPGTQLDDGTCNLYRVSTQSYKPTDDGVGFLYTHLSYFDCDGRHSEYMYISNLGSSSKQPVLSNEDNVFMDQLNHKIKCHGIKVSSYVCGWN